MKEHVIVLGGGVIGLAVAFELKVRGHQVTVLEQGLCGGQASGAAAGMLAPFSEIGEDPNDFFHLAHESLKMYPDWQQAVKEISGKSFEYVQSGSLHCVYHEADFLELESRQHWQGTFGVESEILSQQQIRALEPNISDEIIGAIYYPEESHLFAPDYVKALEIGCRKLGVTIEDEVGHISIEAWMEHQVLRGPSGKQWAGDRLIVCAGAWASEHEETFSLRVPVYPIRGQICAYEVPAGDVRHIVYTSQGYIVPKGNGTVVNGASEDIAGYDTTVTEQGIKRLTNWNGHIFPFLNELTPFHTWAGLRPATQDGYPMIGETKKAPHVVFATGHYRNGILLSPITAKVVADVVEGKKTEVPLTMFDPMRFS
ncbi:glycine oxidase ThiO [Halalkalibacterium halodurans]|uniref:glycine oxidase ThiO n=1 Tax=Halalkalibacterium halodurans TaxID=86665 RepID=UPI0002EACAC3|nr:glycine oxidase ThiO [Halalkalibacterium halodurans]MDY7221957.1 glycine oxidase ThiO [Halalkalibacterium halodurans]MDY7241233.1 glycine oxidase ThiO [Halalkalibacterium halodurans]MED4124629.1 glycine oxidase ThiO [Halalkalibacterium halodurans]MED4173365.1 glycine oxidase ThiO [Halalkalibacterium halodurans]TES50221.1 glycine oxidase ThiO [Halalkalibacterium halodurans]